MNGQNLAAADIAAQIPEIDSGTAEEWRVGYRGADGVGVRL